MKNTQDFYKGKKGHLLVLGKDVRQGVDKCLQGRMEGCLDFMKQNDVHSVVLSGKGRGKNTEAFVMHQHIAKHSKIDVFMEEMSMNTYENLSFSRKMLPESDHVVILSSSYHMRRIDVLAKNIFPSYDIVAAPTPKQGMKRHVSEILWSGWLQTFFFIKKTVNITSHKNHSK